MLRVAAPAQQVAEDLDLRLGRAAAPVQRRSDQPLQFAAKCQPVRSGRFRNRNRCDFLAFCIHGSLLFLPSFARPDQIHGCTGIEIFQGIFAGELPRPPIGDTLDFVPIHIEPGLAVFQGRPQVKHYNPLGTVHGGWFATLLDSAMACAVHSTLPAGKAYTTLELKLNIVRALTDAVPLVRAEGKLIHAGRQVATAEGRLVGPDGKLFGSVTNHDIVEALKAQGHEVERAQIRMPDGALKQVGEFPLQIALHTDVVVKITVAVTGES